MTDATNATVLPFRARVRVVSFPLLVHAGDDTGPASVVARFTHLDRPLLEAVTDVMDVTVVDVRTGRIVAVGGPILGQLTLDLGLTGEDRPGD